MAKQPALIVPAVVLGIIFIIIGYVYVSHEASALPHFFPGYDVTLNTVHTKHGIAGFALGIACFIYAWFQGGPKTTSGTTE